MSNQKPPLAADPLDGVVGSLRECLEVLRRIERDELTCGAGTIRQKPDGTIEEPLYGALMSAISRAQAVLFIHKAQTEGVFFHV